MNNPTPSVNPSSSFVAPLSQNKAQQWNNPYNTAAGGSGSDSLIQHISSSFFPNRRINLPELPIRTRSQVNGHIPWDRFDNHQENDMFEPVPLDLSTAKPRQQVVSSSDTVLADVLGRALDQILACDEPLGDYSTVFDEKTSEKRSPAVLGVKSVAPATKRRRISDAVQAAEDTVPHFRPYQETQWVEQFQELLKFKEERRHCLVPHTFEENPILSRWVKRQRYQYKLKQAGKSSTMTDSRIQKLEDCGFIWDSHAASWEERLNELKKFLAQHGHCNVPSNNPKNPPLATWVKYQRRQCKLFWAGKPSNITLERFSALNQLGFAWELRGTGAMNKNTAPNPNHTF